MKRLAMTVGVWIRPFLVSALFAGMVWALSPVLSGHREPWDSPDHYYPLALGVAGLLAGLLSPRIVGAYFTGAIVGQLLFELIFLESGPLMIVGVAFMCVYALAFLAAALLAAYVRREVRTIAHMQL